MIKSTLDINGYWKVIVYYNVDYNFFNDIYATLRDYNYPNKKINYIYRKLYNREAKAVTISIYRYKVSIVLFNTHGDYYDYINSIIHEAEHVKQAMLYYYNVRDYGEAPAYTIGYIASLMLKVFYLGKI